MESSLDNFKDLLGLPVDMKADIRLEDLKSLDELILDFLNDEKKNQK